MYIDIMIIGRHIENVMIGKYNLLMSVVHRKMTRMDETAAITEIARNLHGDSYQFINGHSSNSIKKCRLVIGLCASS